MDWHRFPPLNALRAFAAVAEAGTTTRAGARLNVSHAAVSQQLRSLETHLGVALVDRSGRSLTLTDDGERLAQVLLSGFGEIDAVIAEITGQEDRRPLQVSLTPTFAANWLMPRLASFRQGHRQVDILLNPTPSVVRLVPGGIDLAIRYGQGHWPGLEAQLLFETTLAVVAAPELVGDRVFDSPSDLAAYPWLQELGTTEASDFLAQYGGEHLRGVGWTEVPGNLMLDGARGGQGIAMTARRFVAPDIAAGRLRLLFEIDLGKGYYLVMRPGVPRPALRQFCAWLSEQARQDVKAGVL
ncbi:LysR family transcriptional regulator, glycine cleavage system transcriptional activator [Salinihabitans flavidus]|uniref:LysR family transcriptional regulator, glycine cleavage system transcriptional activator n=1 Tax=Salinihabitans flavidus TaxID=569882 RepID=A0A1H8V776_9RHOB|nr:LysR family transcriptional regulator [Salinihabitans flavidus]SEP10648.1 LysR family transcriptional regulator, glycine cleavage system transcriptional activator [Salinihabitans flavidus]